MSRWLEAARQSQSNSKTLTDTRQEVAESTARGENHPFLPLSATCRREKSGKSRASENPPVSIQIDRFKERAAMLQEQDGLPRDRAAWLAALCAYALPDERAEYFDQANNLFSQYQRLCLAIGGGMVVTLHSVGRVSFSKEETP